MAQNIISERWVWVQQHPASNPYIQAGQFESPLIQYNAARLQANGACKPALFSGTPGVTPNAFQRADSVLIRRVRIWSPGVALGLAGAGAKDGGSDFTLYTARGGTGTGRAIVIRNPIALGEWVDINETLDASEIGGAEPDADPWQLALHFTVPMLLDASRVASAYHGTAFLKFQVQVDLAHTLAGVTVAYP